MIDATTDLAAIAAELQSEQREIDRKRADLRVRQQLAAALSEGAVRLTLADGTTVPLPASRLGIETEDTAALAAEETALWTREARLLSRQAEVAAEQRRRTEAEHASLVSACRAAKGEVASLRAQADAAQAAWQRARGATENAVNGVAWHRSARPNADDYPTAGELAAWRLELSRRQAEAAAATEAQGQAWESYQGLRLRWQLARERFEALAERERELRAKLNPQRRPAELTATYSDREGVTIFRAG